MKKLLLLAPVFVTSAFSACNCGLEEVGGIAPQIFVDACKTPHKVVAGKELGGFEDCGFDFGARDISVKATQSFTVTNPSTVPLHLIDVVIQGDPSFQLVKEDNKGKRVGLAKDDIIGPGLSGDIVVSVRPRTETTIKTSIFITSDAKNTPQTPTKDGKDTVSVVEIPLTATGVDNGVPLIDVSPLACNYDRVPVSGVKVCDVTIANNGARGLVLDSVDFIPPGSDDGGPVFEVPPESTTEAPFAFAGRPPGPDEEIPPTDANATPPVAPVKLSVQFRPDALGHYAGKFRIQSNDPQNPVIDVTLDGTAVTPPTCVAKIKSVNGVAVGTSTPQIQPLDDVVFSLEDSLASTPDGSIPTFQWSIAEQPTQSRATLSAANSVDTGLLFDANGIHAGVDFAGNYTLQAQVIDDLGVGSVNECSVSFQAIPKQNFHVELSWDTSDNDFDLHVTKGVVNGDTEQYCIDDTSGQSPSGLLMEDCSNDEDCNFATCKRDNTGAPDWDQSGDTHGVADPTLDVDDIDGFGPENQNVDTMAPGDYLIAINEYQGTSEGPATAEVQLFLFGRLAGTWFNDMDVGQVWEVAVVHWPEDLSTEQPCVEDLTDGNAHDQCG